MEQCLGRVFVVEHYEGCRIGLEATLVRIGCDVSVFADSQTCLELLLSEQTQCDLVVMGLRLAPIGGLQLIREIRSTRPSLPIIVLTSSDSATMAIQTLKLGVYDFIHKPVSPDVLIASVRQALSVCSGNHLPVKSLLSSAEYEVLLHILNGETTKQIAAKRNRSKRTIEDQRSAIMRKMKADNVIDLLKRVAVVTMPPEIE
jgi:DNA-binding NarL/FixJ family response regulator